MPVRTHMLMVSWAMALEARHSVTTLVAASNARFMLSPPWACSPPASWRGSAAETTSAGLADHKLAGQLADPWLHGSSLRQGQNQPARFAAELLEVHVDGGERGPGGRGHELPVVEADHRDLAGDA